MIKPHMTQKGIWAVSVGFVSGNGKRVQKKHWLGHDKAKATAVARWAASCSGLGPHAEMTVSPAIQLRFSCAERCMRVVFSRAARARA